MRERHWVKTSASILWVDARRAARAVALSAIVRTVRLLPIAIALLGCTGSQYTVARKTVTPIDAAVIALHQEWQSYDAMRGKAIIKVGSVANATPQSIREALAEWTETGNAVEAAFAALVQQLHVVRAAIDAAEAGAAGALPVREILSALVAKAKSLIVVLRASGVKSPGLDAFDLLVAALGGV